MTLVHELASDSPSQLLSSSRVSGRRSTASLIMGGAALQKAPSEQILVHEVLFIATQAPSQ